MKKTTLLFLFACVFIGAAHSQGFIQLGTFQVEDQGRRLIITSDGGYIIAGSAGNNAVLYKSDCVGQLVAKIEKAYDPGPATFWDVKELSDGSIVAVGGAGIVSPTDTGGQAIMLKTNPLLVEIASSNFSIQNKDAQAKSIVQTPTGHLLVYGEVAASFPDLADLFFQRVDPNTLQPSEAAVVGSNGVDLASRILLTADSNYLLTGSSFVGDISNPDALVDNYIRAYKVDENGILIWQASVAQTFEAKYGVAQSCGAGQSIQSGNFVLGGTIYNGSDVGKQDAIFVLIDNNGTVLDTAFADAPGQQHMYNLAENTAFPGAYAMVGESDGSPLGVPSPVFAQAYETANQLFSGAASVDLTSPISLRDLAELDPGRFAIMGTIPDNPMILTATDIIMSTPETVVGVVFQNCALAATLSTPAVAFQWYLEDQPIPSANQGVYFPTEPGLYKIGVIDNKGCYGISDTFRVEGPVADFTVSVSGLTVTITNASQGAISYFWDFCDGNNSIAPNPVHTYAAPGVYCFKLTVTDNCGLQDTLVQQIGVTPTDEPSWLSHFRLSPNPTGGTFTVEMVCASQEKLAFSVFNAVGQLLSQEELSSPNGWIQKTFDLGEFPAGVYSLQIRSGKEAKNVRVVKN
ncbi:MAG: PKD domain-containing protein [Phycisphaerae bacterium]|nr:PKD domain-containing protein [Saprospiraceae bacterium]